MRPLATLLIAGLALGSAGSPALAEGAEVRVTRHQVPWPGLKRSVRVAHLSDLHLGRFTPRARLESAALAARAARPDLTVLTGDYLNSLRQVRELRELAGRLPRPCLAVLGNHDHSSGAKGVREALRRGGVMVLSNRSRTVRGHGFELTVVGIDDAYSGHHAVREAFAGLARPREALVIVHYPAVAELVAREGGRLILTGHTHGERAVRKRFLEGLYPLAGAQLYVNVGVGSGRASPRRVAPELALFELTPAAEPPR